MALPVLPQWFVDGAAGLGDGIVSGLTLGLVDAGDIRSGLGIDGGVDTCSSAYSVGEFASNFVDLKKGAATGLAAAAKGVIKSSETIGRPVEAVIGNKKRLLRVDIEPNGKLQIQSGRGKNSVVDFRPDLTKPLAPQINKAFKHLPQSTRDQLIKNAEKGLKKLKDTGNM